MTTAPDDHGLDRIRRDLDTTMLVVAGAGTGKTTALVDRIVELVSTGTATLRELAAITFTEAAAAELRDRVRTRVNEAAKARPHDDRLAEARHDVDEAAICTLHAFARRILTEHSVAAGIPPGFEVMDESAERSDFDARWDRFADGLLADPSAEPALVRGFALGLSPTALAEVARAMHARQGQLDEVALDALQAGRPGASGWPTVTARPVIDAIDEALAYEGSCTESDDRMAAHLRDVLVPARALLESATDEQSILQALDNTPTLQCKLGQAQNWPMPVEEVRAASAAAEAARQDLLDAIRRAVVAELGARIASFVLTVSEERRSAGSLGFGDLLVFARDLLRRDPAAARTLRRHYRWLLVDEFQDTDPIQVEIAARLCASDEGSEDLHRLRPGALFLVGDPEQSIYRFRRADIEVFGRVREQIGEVVGLRTNYRSVPGILGFVNTVFDELLGDDPVPGQAPHQDLVGERGPLRDQGPGIRGPSANGSGAGGSAEAVQLQLAGFASADETGEPAPTTGRARPLPRRGPAIPPVVVLGGPRTGSLAEIRRSAGRDVADAVSRVVGDEWLIDDVGATRPAHWRDIAVLIPARSALPALEEAFEDAAVPYRLEGVAMLWASDDVREVLAVLHAADDPADPVAVLTALRSPGLACGDDDLVEWRQAGGRWDPRAPVPPGLELHPVASAMTSLNRLRDERFWSEPSALVGRAFTELRSFETCLASRRPRDHWHRLRWLWDQARLFDDTWGGTLRDFLRWAEQEAADDRRTGGVGPPDPDDDAVRVMTVHGAKGLEFPVVVVAGLERDPVAGQRSPAVLWDDDGTPELSAGADFRTPGYALASHRDRQLDALEQDRLLYVAMTRARDHLLVCLHHKEASGTTAAARVMDICERHRQLWRRPPIPTEPATTPAAGDAPVVTHVDPSPTDSVSGTGLEPGAGAEAWRAHVTAFETRRRDLLRVVRHAPVATATEVATFLAATTGPIGAGEAPDGASRQVVDRGGEDTTALQIGRAVHGALAVIDLHRGTDAAGRSEEEVARTAAATYGVSEHAADVVAMVAAARRAPTVTAAATRPHWRELYVAAPADDGVLEGIADLVVDERDGLAVVDYKTDRIDGRHRLEELADHYLPQLATYAQCLEAATGRAVVRCALVFVAGGQPREVTFEGQALAAARARAVGAARDLFATC